MRSERAAVPGGRRELKFMSPAYRGGCVGGLLVFVAFWTGLVVLFVVAGKATGGNLFGIAFLACSALFFLWLALLVWRKSRTTLDGTILSHTRPLRRVRSCDLARVDSARVSFGIAQISDGTGQIGAMRTCELRLEGGGDLTVLSLRQGFRWPQPGDLRSLVRFETNENKAAVAPAIAILNELARNHGRAPREPAPSANQFRGPERGQSTSG